MTHLGCIPLLFLAFAGLFICFVDGTEIDDWVDEILACGYSARILAPARHSLRLGP